MPIIRRDETTDTLAPRVLFLWTQKWWVLGPAFAVFVLTYIGCLFWPQEYRATAEIYVNRFGEDRFNEVGSPAAIIPLLKSDQVLLKVRDAFEQKFHSKPVFEKFVKQFTAKTEVLQDTTVKKDLSPVVQLTVQAHGKDTTQFLMDTWTSVSVADFGNFAVTEARLKLELLKKEDARLEADLKSAESERGKYSAELPFQSKLLAEQMDLLAPAEMPPVSADGVVVLDRNSANMQVNMQQRAPVKPPGLVARKLQLELQLAQARQVSGATGGTTSAAELESGIKALNTVMEQTKGSIVELQKSVADLEQKRSTAERRVQVLTGMQRELHKLMDEINTFAALYAEPAAGEGLPTAGDLRVLTRPVLPELRVWPKRTLVAGVAGLAALIICICAALFREYVQRAANAAAASSG